MAYKVVLSKRARRQVLKLPPGVDRRIEDAIDSLAEAPRPEGAKKLQGVDDLYRLRVGSFRIIYQIQDRKLVVLIVKVGNRRDVYRGE